MSESNKSFLDKLSEIAYNGNGVDESKELIESQIPLCIEQICKKIKDDISKKAKNGTFTITESGKKKIIGVYDSTIGKELNWSHLCQFHFLFKVSPSLQQRLKQPLHSHELVYTDFSRTYPNKPEYCLLLTPKIETTTKQVQQQVQKEVTSKGFLFFKKKETVTETVTKTVNFYSAKVTDFSKKILDEVIRNLTADGINVTISWNSLDLDEQLCLPETIAEQNQNKIIELFNKRREAYPFNRIDCLTIKYSVEF